MRDDTNASLLLEEEMAELRRQNAERRQQHNNLQLLLAQYEDRVTDLEWAHQTERALRQSEERFHALFDNAPVGISLYSDDGQVLLANQALAVMTGE